MLLQLLVARIRSLLLLLLGIVNRALCCFSRKRRNSFSDCAEPLMLVSIGAEQTTAGTGGPAGQNRGRRDEVSLLCGMHRVTRINLMFMFR